jgi:hypothetical protein
MTWGFPNADRTWLYHVRATTALPVIVVLEVLSVWLVISLC